MINQFIGSGATLSRKRTCEESEPTPASKRAIMLLDNTVIKEIITILHQLFIINISSSNLDTFWLTTASKE